MKKSHTHHIPSILLMALLSAGPVKAQTDFVEVPSPTEWMTKNQVPHCSLQVPLGKLLEGETVNFSIAYPEYVTLTASQKARFKALGARPSAHIELSVAQGIERGNTIADVSFTPLIERNGKWLLLSNFKLQKTSSAENLPQAFRLAAQAATQVQAAIRYASHSVLASGKWVKIKVNSEGLYQLSASQLQKMGFSDISKVKLYGQGGRPLVELASTSDKDAWVDDLKEIPLFRRDNSVVFFAEGTIRWNTDGSHRQNAFSASSCYFLTEGDSPAQLTTLTQPTATATEVTQVKAHALTDNDGYCWYEGGRDFYESETVGSSKRYKLQLPGLVGASSESGTSANVDVAWDIACSNAVSSTTVNLVEESSGSVLSRGTISAANGDGESARGYRASFSTNQITSQQPVLQVRSTDTQARLNYIRINYPQQLAADNPAAAFSPNVKGAVKLVIANADAHTRVWQIASGNADAAVLPSDLSGTTLTAYAPDGTQRFVIVNEEQTFSSPQTVGNVSNQDLHADSGIQYVVIVPSSGKLTEQANRLAEEHRTRDGLTAKVVTAEEIYNEFSSGTPDATAYRRYLKMLYDKAATDSERPQYLVLFGDCLWDNRGVTAEYASANHNDYLLSYERNDQESYTNSGYSIGTLHSYVTDDYYGLLDDSEGNKIESEKVDVGIGRMPCHDAATAKILVDRTIKYMDNKSTGAWKNSMFSIADSGDENSHMTDADTICAQTSRAAGENFLVRRLYLDSYTATQTAQGTAYPAATEHLKQLMQQGALIFNYNGHGSPDRLSHKFLIYKEDMAANVSQALPLWIYASCEISPYDQPISDLGRNALYNVDGGAVGVICAARSVYSNYNRAIDKGIVKYLFSKDSEGKRLTFGSALRKTKNELITSGSTIGSDYTMNKLKYVLLGDPAVALAYADDGISIDSINATALKTSATQTIATGAVTRFSGKVTGSGSTADESFNGTLTATLLAPAETITCKGQGNSSADPKVYKDYTRSLYQGDVKVTNGEFHVDIVLPRGVNLSTDRALLSLYAVSDDSTREYKGRETRFCINATGQAEKADTLGPDIYVYLDRPDFPNGGVVDVDATFYASVSDSTALSVASGALGHDVELILDNDASNAIRLNDYFKFDFGSYNNGLVEYPLTGLTPGVHSLSFRMWDVYDNSTTARLQFEVRQGGASSFEVNATELSPGQTARFVTSFIRQAEGDVDVVTEVYNTLGYRVWTATQRVSSGEYATADWNFCDQAGHRLPQGVYFYRSKVYGKETKTKKIIVR